MNARKFWEQSLCNDSRHLQNSEPSCFRCKEKMPMEQIVSTQ